MPRWSLVLLGVGALLFAFRFFGFIPKPYLVGAAWASCAAPALGAVVAGKRNLAIWCGLFAALFVLTQPLFPIDLGRYDHFAALLAAALLTVCVIRHW